MDPFIERKSMYMESGPYSVYMQEPSFSLRYDNDTDVNATYQRTDFCASCQSYIHVLAVYLTSTESLL